ncbi:unnamed protein product [Linum trigynum]|uniref:Uncharacterized protein n=1 Tax=Linum trigynum TaxID=586398 RepID=A0AAV2E9B6_9ROSI
MGDNEQAYNIVEAHVVGECSASREIFNVDDSDVEEGSEVEGADIGSGEEVSEEEGADIGSGEEGSEVEGADSGSDEEGSEEEGADSGDGEEANQSRAAVGSYEEDESNEDFDPDEASTPTHRSQHVLDDEEPEDMMDNLPFYDPLCDHKQFEFHVGLKFLTVETFKKAVAKHAVSVGAS